MQSSRVILNCHDKTVFVAEVIKQGALLIRKIHVEGTDRHVNQLRAIDFRGVVRLINNLTPWFARNGNIGDDVLPEGIHRDTVRHDVTARSRLLWERFEVLD